MYREDSRSGPYADRNPAYQINPRTPVIVRRVGIKCNPFMQRYKDHLCAEGIDVVFQPANERNNFNITFSLRSFIASVFASFSIERRSTLLFHVLRAHNSFQCNFAQ